MAELDAEFLPEQRTGPHDDIDIRGTAMARTIIGHTGVSGERGQRRRSGPR
jgi:hypothetical protein